MRTLLLSRSSSATRGGTDSLRSCRFRSRVTLPMLQVLSHAVATSLLPHRLAYDKVDELYDAYGFMGQHDGYGTDSAVPSVTVALRKQDAIHGTTTRMRRATARTHSVASVFSFCALRRLRSSAAPPLSASCTSRSSAIGVTSAPGTTESRPAPSADRTAQRWSASAASCLMPSLPRRGIRSTAPMKRPTTPCAIVETYERRERERGREEGAVRGKQDGA